MSSIPEKFNLYKKKWRSETSHLSNPVNIYTNEHYLRIISLGEAVIPFILKSYKTDESIYWGYALYIITGERPYPIVDVNDLDAIRDCWLKWGEEKGYMV